MSVPTQENNVQAQLPEDIANDPNISDAERALIESGAPNPNDAPEPDDGAVPDTATPPVNADEVDNKAIEQALNGTGDDNPADPNPQPNLKPDPAEPQEDLPDFEGLVTTIDNQIREKNTRADAIIGELETLAEQLDGGEVGQAKYDVSKLKLERELRAIDADVVQLNSTKTDLTNQAQTHQVKAQNDFEQRWNAEVNTFLQQPENAAFNTNPQLSDMFDKTLEGMQAGGLLADLSMPQVLAAVRAQIALRVQLPVPSVSAPAQPTAKPAKQKSDLPPTLGDMNSFENNQASSGEFDHIFRLSGGAFDDAIAGLTDDQFSRMSKALNQRGGR